MATRMSAIIASSMPQPTAAPFTAAITGTSVCSSASAAGREARCPGPGAGVGQRGLALGAAAHHLAHVVAAAERRVGTGDDQAPHTGRRRLADQPLELGVHAVGQRVAGVGTVEGDHADVVVTSSELEEDSRVTPPTLDVAGPSPLRQRRAPMNMPLSAS